MRFTYQLLAKIWRPDSVSFCFNLKAKKEDGDHKGFLKTATIREVCLYFIYGLSKRVELALSLRRVLALPLSCVHFHYMRSIHRRIFKHFFRLLKTSIHVYAHVYIYCQPKQDDKVFTRPKEYVYCTWILTETQPSTNSNSAERKSIQERQQNTLYQSFLSYEVFCKQSNFGSQIWGAWLIQELVKFHLPVHLRLLCSI